MPTSLLGKAYRKEARKTTDSRKYLVLPQKAPAKNTAPAAARTRHRHERRIIKDLE